MKVPILTLSSALVKICQIPKVIFQTTYQFFFKFSISPQYPERWLLRIVLGQTLYTLVTRSPLKDKFVQLLSARVKFAKFFLSISKRQVNSSSIFYHFSLSQHVTALYILSLYIFYFGQKDPIKVPILTLSSALVEICKIANVIFQTTIQFFLKFCMFLQCHERWLLFTVLAHTLYTLIRRSPKIQGF